MLALVKKNCSTKKKLKKNILLSMLTFIIKKKFNQKKNFKKINQNLLKFEHALNDELFKIVTK